MIDHRMHLESEIKELQLEIRSGKQTLSVVQNILEQKQQQLKQMNDAHRNTNEAVENKLKENLISDLQSKNWYVDMGEIRKELYPKPEVVDENTVKIEGVEYKKVEKQPSITLERIITDCMIGYNNTVIVELMERILDRVEVEFLTNKVMLDVEEPLSVMMDYGTGWKNCIKYLKEKLRE